MLGHILIMVALVVVLLLYLTACFGVSLLNLRPTTLEKIARTFDG